MPEEKFLCMSARGCYLFAFLSEQNHGKPKDGISAKIILHLFFFYNFICNYAMTFQAWVHIFRIAAWLTFFISTGVTDIAGFCGENKNFISLLFYVFTDFCRKLLMFPRVNMLYVDKQQVRI